MKQYGIDTKVIYKGKEVTIKEKEHNFSNGNIKYLLDNGKTVTGSELEAVAKILHVAVKKGKTNINKLGKDIEDVSKKSEDIQIKESVINEKSTEKNSKDGDKNPK